MKRKQSPCKPGSVPLAGCLPFIYSAGYPTALAFYPPSYLERFGRTALNRWFTRTCSLQMEQPDDHPPAGGLLHHLLPLTHVWAVIFFSHILLSPIAGTFTSGASCAARTFLSCPYGHQRQTVALLSACKVTKYFLINNA